ncbi:development and cell death domain-containing protein [Pelagophyceae sp. CCMP2097]|nr:development and cell death domain-containing protein [Pelagophyceae sp. CCMP2097]
MTSILASLAQHPPPCAAGPRPLRAAPVDRARKSHSALGKLLEEHGLGIYGPILDQHDAADLATLRILLLCDYEAMGIPARIGDEISRLAHVSTPAFTIPPAFSPAPAPALPPAFSPPPPPPQDWRAAARAPAAPAPPRAPAPRAPPASTRGAADSFDAPGGFIFLCDKKTRDEVFRRKLFGLPRNHLKHVKQITRTTVLFLLDFSRSELHGPFKAVGAAALDLEPEAWEGKFSAQLRFEPLIEATASLKYGAASILVTKGEYQSGALTLAKKDELLRRLLA